MLLILLAACDDASIKLNEAPGDDTGGVDTAPGDTAPDDTGVVIPEEDPLTGNLPVNSADIILLGDRTEGIGYAGGMAAVGDVTGDGKGDLLVGARYGDLGAGPYSGGAYLVSDPPLGTSMLADSAVRITGDTEYSQFGYTVSAAGDVNGDGSPDFAVSEPMIDSGSVYLFNGPFTGDTLSAATADTILVGESQYSYTGTAVSPAGDMNGDGKDDLMVGAPYDSAYCQGCGAVYVSLAAGAGVPTVLGDESVVVYGTRDSGAIGAAFAPGVDLDGDGALDLAVGAPSSARGGLVLAYGPFRAGSFDADAADAQFSGATMGSGAGTAVTSGDFDGNGYPDLAIGAPMDTEGGNYAGKVYVLAGGATRYSGLSDLPSDTTFFGATQDAAGTAVTAAGDVDGDGTEDLLIGAPYASAGAMYGGGSYLVYGPVTTGSHSLADSGAIFTGVVQYGYAGWSLAGPGDMGGDGLADVAIAAVGGLDPSVGAVFVFLGD